MDTIPTSHRVRYGGGKDEDQYYYLDERREEKREYGYHQHHGHGWRIFSTRPSVRSHGGLMSSVSYRRERARKRNLFLQTYKLGAITSNEKVMGSRKLRKLVVAVKTAVVAALAFMRGGALRSSTSHRSANRLRKDVAELLKYGLDKTAFQRVEQLIKEEKTIQVYDLLDQFCEHIIINLPYIRKHKDCPKEINEAASTIIFASARLGEFPELLSIRKLFEERYGQRFVMNAVKLLPGNIVSLQMIKKVQTRNVSGDDEKYKLLDEIAASCVLSGQYLLEYRPEWQEVQKLSVNQDDETNKGTAAAVGKSSSEASVRLPDKTMCLDDIEEHMLPAYKNERLQDQRVLMSKSYGLSINKKMDYGIDIYVKEQELSLQKPVSRSTRKMRKGRRKRARRRSASQESRITTDTECVTYYGDSEETSPDSKGRSHFQHREKILARGRSKSFGTKVRNTFNGYQDENDTQKGTTMNLATHIQEEEVIQHKLQIYKYRHHTCRTGCNEAGEATKPITARAMTMPAERPIADPKENTLRSVSFPLEQPHCNYSCPWQPIHPKLPDYDDLTARFVALKRENLQHKLHFSGLEV